MVRGMIFLIVLIAGTSMAGEPDIIHLEFDGVRVRNLEFKDIPGPELDRVKGGRTVFEENGYLWVFHSDVRDSSTVDLCLPTGTDFLLNLGSKDNTDEVFCIFNDRVLRIISNGRALLSMRDSQLLLNDAEGDRIAISRSNLHIVSDSSGSVVHIGPGGIIISDGDSTETMTGFWGRILGSIITGTVGSVMDEVSNENGQISLILDLINNESTIELNK